jgi:hypothetical protein
MKVASIFTLSTLAVFVSAAKPTQTCPSLEVRREWRTFSKAERKGWIDAVNVRLIVATSIEPIDLFFNSA